MRFSQGSNVHILILTLCQNLTISSKIVYVLSDVWCIPLLVTFIRDPGYKYLPLEITDNQIGHRCWASFQSSDKYWWWCTLPVRQSLLQSCLSKGISSLPILYSAQQNYPGLQIFAYLVLVILPIMVQALVWHEFPTQLITTAIPLDFVKIPLHSQFFYGWKGAGDLALWAAAARVLLGGLVSEILKVS